MIFVKDIEKQERLKICKACKYYKEETKTCGTFRVLKPEGDTITYRKKKVKLCGCIMPLKTKFKGVSCPINKWKGILSRKESEYIKGLLKMTKGKEAIPTKLAKEIIDIYNKAFNTKKKLTPCKTCMKTIIEELKNSIYQYPNEDT